MTTLTLSGISHTGTSSVTGIGTSQLRLVVPDGDTGLSYSVLSSPTGTLPEVSLTAPTTPYHFEVGGTPIATLAQSIHFGVIAWGVGQISFVLRFHDVTGAAGPADTYYDFVLAGAPLGPFSDIASFNAYTASITHIGAVGPGAFGPGSAIDLTQVPGIGQTEADQIIAPVSGGTFSGGAGDDTLTGDAGADVFFGGTGHDRLTGGPGDDRLIGEDGNDTLYGGDGLDTLNGGDGDDFIFGGDTAADLRDLVFAGAGNDTIDGGYGNDNIFGQDGDDNIQGGFGSDTLQGQAGNDVITGGALSDEIHGNAGDDFVNGGFGHDRINGGSGADRFYHLGIFDHGSDWIQDYDAAEGDILLWGQGGAAPAQFQINYAHTEDSGGERSGDDNVTEAFVIYIPTGQIIWALVDGGGQDEIIVRLSGVDYDLLA